MSTTDLRPPGTSPEDRALQDRYAPNNRCFGCGPANDQGLRIKSFPVGDELHARWQPEGHHEAFRGMLNGGICGALLDCHLNWTACFHLMQLAAADTPPCTVTAEYKVQLMRPTPTDRPLDLVARVVETPKPDRAWVEGELLADGVVTARCRGLFVAVKEGHPAYHRW